MERPKPRRRREARPAELLAAALDVFAEKGFSAARQEEIAARAGVSKGTLYLYFPSKEALLEALIDTAILPNFERVEALVGRWRGTSAGLLRVLARGAVQLIRKGPITAFPKIIIAEATNFPDLAARYRNRVIDRGLGLIGGIIRRGIERGEFRAVEAETAAKLCIAPLLLSAIWLTCFAQHDKSPFDLDGLLRTHIETFLRGLAKGEEVE